MQRERGEESTVESIVSSKQVIEQTSGWRKAATDMVIDWAMMIRR